MLLSKLKARFPRKLYKYIKDSLCDFETRRAKTTVDLASLTKPIYIIATPGNLPCVKLCLNHIPRDEECVVVFNGLEPWECSWATRHLKCSGFITLRKMVRHYHLIDYLISKNRSVFGIVDFDCFVFDETVFQILKDMPPTAAFSSFYGKCTNDLSIIFPETFLLYMDAEKLRKISRKYQANSTEKDWNSLSRKTRDALLGLGFDEKTLPENWKTYYDTSRALMALSLVENYTFHFPFGPRANSDNEFAIHIGYMASVPIRGVYTKGWYQARGSYFWNRALESLTDKELKQAYTRKYGYTRPEDILERIDEEERRLFYKNDFLGSVERIIGKNI
jgi:hypothetical protein